MTADTTTTTTAPRKEASGVLKRSSRFFIDPALVAFDPGWNNRIDMGDIESLANSIKYEVEREPENGGLLEEIGVRRLSKDDALRLSVNPMDKKGDEREKEFAVVWGHRRTNAVWMNIARGVVFPVGIPAKIVDKAQDIQASMISMLAENVGQKPLAPLEEATGYKKLRDGFPDQGIKGMSIKAICESVGRARPHVEEMLALLEADDDVKDALAKGEIGKQMAKVIASRAKGDKTKQKALVAQAKAARGKKGAKGAVKQAAEDAKAASKGKAPKIRALSNAELSALGVAVGKCLVTRLTEAGKAIPKSFDDKATEELRAWIKKDDKLALAATFGALEALKAAAGMKLDLEY